MTPAIREWDYGAYEGITSPNIRKLRASQGLSPAWDIWKDGCPEGESPQDIMDRLDAIIAEIRETYHKPVMDGESKDGPGDVLIVAHGHILRAFAMRWAGKLLHESPAFLLEAGGVGTLRYVRCEKMNELVLMSDSYEHNNIEEPAILLGGAFVVSK